MTGHDVGGITSALAKAGIGTDDRHDASHMAPTLSQSSDGEADTTNSAPSLNAEEAQSSATSIQIQRPSYLRQSLSDGVSGDANSFDGLATLGGGPASLPTTDIPVSLPTTGPLSASDPRTQLYVSNLPYRVRWQDLKDLFRRAGTVLRADVSLTPENRSRGYGTVLLATEDDARRACEMFRGFNWQGRTLDVKIDRSGTLLGVGVAQLTPSAALLTAANAGAAVSPQSILLGGHSPHLSSLAAQTPAPFAANPSTASNQSAGVYGHMPPTPAIGCPAPQGHTATPSSQLHPQSHSSLAATPDPSSPARNGVSPALLPFFNLSSRASLASGAGLPSSSSNFNAQAQHGWPQQQQGPFNIIQQRSASLGGGSVAGTGPAGSPSPFSVARQTLPAKTAFPAAPHTFQTQASIPSLTSLGQQTMRQNASGNAILPTGNYGHAQQTNSIGGVVLPQMPVNAAGVAAPSHAYYGRVLFVGNLPFHCQWQDLKDLFRAAGNILRADVALTAEGKSRGFGTVLFATPEDAQNAVRIYHGYMYSGRTLKVHFDRFAQMTVPPPGTLPASPSQYTSAFAAANTPTPASTNATTSTTVGMDPVNVAGQHMYHQQNIPTLYGLPAQQQFAYGNGATFAPFQQGSFGAAGRQQPMLLPLGGEGQFAFNASPYGRQALPFAASNPYSQEGDSPFVSTVGYPTGQYNMQAPAATDAVAPDQSTKRDERETHGESKEAEEEPASDGEDSASASAAKDSTADDADRKLTKAADSTASSGAHPGRIQLPPQQFATPMMASFSPTHARMSVPMTPGMPGFTFHAIPDTPPVVPHHFLSPGLGGPFSPPLASPTFVGPATPGAPYVGYGRSFNPGMNAAPGAPLHMNNGAATPLGGGTMAPDSSNFNPMFPPIGAAYQRWPTQEAGYVEQHGQQQSRLPQTPHWSQPRRPQKQRGPAGEALQEGEAPKEEDGDGKGAANGKDHGLREIQQSTGASSTEELARKIAQMSAQKVLMQQQQRVRGGSVPYGPGGGEGGDNQNRGVEMRSQSSTGSMLDAPMELRLNRKPSRSRLSSAALSGSALDDEAGGLSAGGKEEQDEEGEN